MWVQTLGQEDPLEEGMAIHSSILAWRISWTEEPGRLQFIGSQSWTQEVTQHAYTHRQSGLPLSLCKATIHMSSKHLPLPRPSNQGGPHDFLCFSRPFLLGWIWEVGVKESLILLDPPLG